MNQEKLEKINKIIGNKSNILFRESYFKNNFESLTNEILNYTKDLNLEKFPQKVWHWVNEKEDYFKCEICNVNKTKFNNNWLNGYKKYCSAKCAANSETTKQKRTKTCLEIYGFDNVSKNENIKKKTEETNIKKYGYKSTFQNENVRNKWKKTIYDKYGVEHISKVDNIIKIKEENNIKKFGYKSTLEIPHLRDKVKKDNNLKYGVDYIQQTENYKIKKKETFLKIFGVENPMYDSSVKNKLKKTKNIKTEAKYLNLLKEKNDYSFIKYENSTLTFKHEKCNTIQEINIKLLYDRTYIHNSCICLKCNPINDSKSYKEKEILEWLKTINVHFIDGDRNILNGKELDIYIPEYNLAIEFNGLYWHSEKYKDKNYHLNKTILCREKNIHLIHVWEDEWKYKKEIIKSIILNKLDKSEKIIYARKCTITQINDNKVVEEFLKNNDINGYIKGDIYLGLYYKNELINITSFKKKINKNIEIVSICNKLNYKIIDNFSKIFKYFIKNYEYNIITSSTDISKFEGNVFKNTGFILKESTNPNSWYIDYDIRTKIKTNNIRIYGCGYHKWIYKKNIL